MEYEHVDDKTTVMLVAVEDILPRGAFSAVWLLAAVYQWPPQLKGFFVPISQKATTTNPALTFFQPITSDSEWRLDIVWRQHTTVQNSV